MPSRSSATMPAARSRIRARARADREDAAALNANVAASMMNDVPGPTSATMHAADRRAEEVARRLADDLLDRARLRDQRRREDVGHERAERGGEERLADAVDEHEQHEHPDLERAAQRERADGELRDRARSMSAPIITRRRSSRSLRTPASRMNSTRPPVHASPTSASALGSLCSS